MKRDFTKFVASIVVFMVLLIGCDFVMGKMLDKAMSIMPNTKSQTARTNYCINKATADCIIIGSSRASDHYVSNILADSLNMRVYNAGRQGYGYAYAYGALQSICSRQVPQIVILEIDDNELCRKDEPTSVLKPYYGIDHIKKIIGHNATVNTRIAMNFTYRFNGLLISMLNAFMSSEVDDESGYVNLGNESNIKISDSEVKSKDEKRLLQNTESIAYLQGIVKLSKETGFKLFLFSSPRYTSSCNIETVNFIRQFESNNIYYTDYSYVESINNTASLFYDYGHLNNKGAERYSALVANRINEYLKQ